MHGLSVAELAALGGRDYIAEIKARLRNDVEWAILLDPVLVERTRWGLNRIIESIDRQVGESAAISDAGWLIRAKSLRGYASSRLDRMAPEAPSNTKEARAWRAFSAELARVLEGVDPEALRELRAPYGGLSAAEWLSAREAKKRVGR